MMLTGLRKRPVKSCQECRYKTSNDSHFLTHQNIHAIQKLGFKVYKCPKCYFIAESRTSLAIHKRILGHSKKKHRCKFCGFTAKSAGAISLHNKREHSLRPCPYCHISVCSGWDLREHLRRVHVDESQFKEYTCKRCHFVCHTNLDICHHIKAHNARGKIYSCSESSCLFITYKHDKLIEHIKSAKHDVGSCSFSSVPMVATRSKACSQKTADEYPANVPIIRVVQTKTPETIYVDSDDSVESGNREVPSNSYKKAARCIYCSTTTTFSSHEALQQHLQKVHNMNDLKDNIYSALPRLYRCKFCKKRRFSSIKLLRAHTYKCDPRAGSSYRRLKLSHKPRIKRHSTDAEIKSGETNVTDKPRVQNIFDKIKQMEMKFINSGSNSSEKGCKAPALNVESSDFERNRSESGEDASAERASTEQATGLRPTTLPTKTPELIIANTAEIATIVTPECCTKDIIEPVRSIKPELVTAHPPELVTTIKPELLTPVTPDYSQYVTPPYRHFSEPSAHQSPSSQHHVSPSMEVNLGTLANLPDMSLSELQCLHRYYMYQSHFVNLYQQQYQLMGYPHFQNLPQGSPYEPDANLPSEHRCIVLGCGGEFTSLASLLVHMKFSHDIHMTPEMELVCADRESHPPDKVYTCSLCEERCTSHDAFVWHFKQRHL